MTRIQQWLAGTVIAVLAIVAAGWFVAIAPQKHKASSLTSQASQQEQSNDGLRNRLTALTAQMSAVPAEEASVAAIAAKIPADPELPSYVRALSTIASQTGVELVSIAPGVPTAVVAAAATVAPTPAASASASASAAPVAAAPAPASLQAISIGVDVQGGYFQIQQFTAALQRLARSTVVTSLSIAPGSPIKTVASASGGTASPSAAATSAAWKTLSANITLSVFMNTSTPFTAIPVPSPAGAAAPTAAAGASASVAPLLPSAPSASASN
jgi:Tfp pilus assembly protein PilO